MNRATRRAQRSAQVASRADILQVLAVRMAEAGPSIRVELEKAVGGPVKSGHIVDALMTATAKWHDAMEAGDTVIAFQTLTAVLWLARALAHAEGKIRETPAAQA